MLQLLENYHKIKNKFHITKNKAALSQDAKADELFVVMQRAHTQDPSHKFAHDIKTAPEPAIILADDQ